MRLSMYLCQPTRGWGRVGEYKMLSARALVVGDTGPGFHCLPPVRPPPEISRGPSGLVGADRVTGDADADGAWSARSSGLAPRPSRSTAWVTGATAPLFHLLRSTCSSRLSDTTHSKSLVTGHAPPRCCRGLPPTVAVRTKVYCSA